MPLAIWLADRHDVAEVYHDGVARVFVKRIDKFAPWLSPLAGVSLPSAGRTTGRHVPFPG